MAIVLTELTVVYQTVGYIIAMLQDLQREALKGENEQYERDELRKALEALVAIRSRLGPKWLAEQEVANKTAVN